MKNIVIKEAEELQLSDWILPLQEAFESTKESASVYLEAHIHALHKGANFQHFVASAGDEPVSASTLSLSSHGARLDDLGIKPAYQRKGIGSAITLHLMKVAKNLSYEWICLDASEEGALLYKSMGFQELCQNEMYGKAQ